MIDTKKPEYDFFVIGAGSGGVRAARTAASLGAKTAIAESRFLGGTCVNVGCIPKKLYSYAAHASLQTQVSESYGWSGSSRSFDWSVLKKNKDTEIQRLNGIYQNLLVNAGVEIHHGKATITEPGLIEVAGQSIRARHILIATGGEPFIPAIPGSELALDSDGFFALEKQPEDVIVVGGGFIACELAGVFHGLGTQVTLVHRRDKLLTEFDQDISDFYSNRAIDQYNTRLKTEVVRIEAVPSSEKKHVYYSDGTEQQVDQVIFATGRRPNTAGLNLAEIGVELTAKGAVKVDDSFQTKLSGVYAVGDVIDRVALTPVALAEGQALAHHLFGQQKNKSTVSYELIPSAVFSHPQIATVGLTEQEAKAKGIEFDRYLSRFRPLLYTMGKEDEFSLMKLLVEKGSDKVIGIHMAGDDAAEIMQGMAVALQAGATKADFDRTIGIHPTAAEEFVTMRTPA
ncbi:glutathione-disulfide reductase [Pseudohongiella nitratireducens]|uniref:Glutathione-disulfide reductase n=1 Tax=Pseudohongiella nitratireducens TaxID=1768907 RepID=A0A916QM11_9GAMM|nr:glutathione-disulfide reductase [Pseudohongiella nitratireducens]GFZ82450.1 glutathione-disulfide reductase [Pseudohongiella nitratireducens]